MRSSIKWTIHVVQEIQFRYLQKLGGIQRWEITMACRFCETDIPPMHKAPEEISIDPAYIKFDRMQLEELREEYKKAFYHSRRV